MDSLTVLITILLAILPISELRGAIPFAWFRGIPMGYAFLISVFANCLIAPLGYLFFSTIHEFIYVRWAWYASVFDRSIARARIKIEKKINTFGYAGLMLFVGIPLPITGAWTGVLGAWILGLDRKKTILFISLGVILSGLIVTGVLLFGSGIHSIFVKEF